MNSRLRKGQGINFHDAVKAKYFARPLTAQIKEPFIINKLNKNRSIIIMKGNKFILKMNKLLVSSRNNELY